MIHSNFSKNKFPDFTKGFLKRFPFASNQVLAFVYVLFFMIIFLKVFFCTFVFYIKSIDLFLFCNKILFFYILIQIEYNICNSIFNDINYV